MKNKNTLKGFLLLPIYIFLGLSNANAAIQEDCFNTLKVNMSEIATMSEPYNVIQNLDYSSIEPQFSKYYKNFNSFGVDLDEARFELRLYSYGRQTSYQEPIVGPFTSNNEKWESPAKEYIIAEEYVTDDNGERHFLSCSFMHIGGDGDPINISAEDYWYDGQMTSVLKQGSNYKAWYNENWSYNFDNEVFIEWQRLFIYPEESQNDYFDKYIIIDSFPSNKVDNFDFFSDLIASDDKEDKIIAYEVDDMGNIYNVEGLPEELTPIDYYELNPLFALYDFYQEIENSFPDFANHLALKGVLNFNTIKEMVIYTMPDYILDEKIVIVNDDGTETPYEPAEGEAMFSDYFSNIYNVAINSMGFKDYYRDRQSGTISNDDINKASSSNTSNISNEQMELYSRINLYERYYQDSSLIEKDAEGIIAGLPEIKKAETTNIINNNNPTKSSETNTTNDNDNNTIFIIIALIGLVTITGIIIIMVKNNNKNK